MLIVPNNYQVLPEKKGFFFTRDSSISVFLLTLQIYDEINVEPFVLTALAEDLTGS